MPKKGPQFVRFFAPVLESLKELGGSGRPAEVRELVAEKVKLTDEARAELLDGGIPRFDNQVGWARFYLVKADYLDSSQRGVWTLTDKGRAVDKFSHADALAAFKEVQNTFRPDSAGTDSNVINEEEQVAPSNATPPDEDYRTQLLNLLKTLSPAGFERLCQRLLRESGFEEVQVTGRSGDGGIDGEGRIKLNVFVSFKVLFQCKRYQGSVTPSQVRDFRGAMQGRADKGIILTTGTFTADAQKEALRDGAPPVELVNGDKLLDLFEQLELGLKPRNTYEIDRQFFEQFK